MRDAQTGTYWQQITGLAVAGPLAGRRLPLVSADELTFALWRAEQPKGTVLDDLPRYAKDYAPENWDVKMAKAPTVLSYAQAGLKPRDLMLGIRAFGASRAFPYTSVLEEKLIEDPQDAITLSQPVPDYMQALHASISNIQMGVPRDYFFESLDPDVSAAVEEAIRHLKGKVREIRDVTLPRLHVAENGTYDVELYHYQKPFFDKTPELYHPWSQRQMNELKNVQTVPYVETLKRVRESRRDIQHTFDQVDVLVLPTMREPAPLISETVNETHHRPHSNTSAFNHFGTPAMTVPCGFSRDGLPIGLQFVGPAYGEPAVLSIAYAYQESTDWHKRTPPIVNI